MKWRREREREEREGGGMMERLGERRVATNEGKSWDVMMRVVGE